MKKNRIVYIAHAISGDVEANKERVRMIIKDIIQNEPDVVPIAPYLTSLEILDNNSPMDVVLGFDQTRKLFESGGVEQIRLYGNSFSKGMAIETLWAHEYEMSIVPYFDDEALVRFFDEWFNKMT